MTAILAGADNGPCIVRTITTDAGTFEHREWPILVARFRTVIENRAPVRRQQRGAGGRFGKVVLS